MRLDTRFIARVGILVILGQSLASCQGGGPTGPSSNVTLSTNSILFSIADEQRPVRITNLGTSMVDWRLAATSASWLTVSPATGTVEPHETGEFTVMVNRAAVSQGTHSASLQVMVGGELHSVDVSVDQGGAAEASFHPSSISLQPLDGSSVIEVLNTGGSVLNWNLTSAAPWVTMSPSSGSTAPGGSSQVVLLANRTGMTPGTYKSSIYLTGNGGPRTAEITLEVGETAGLRLDPGTLAFGLSTSQLPLRLVNDGYETLTWRLESAPTWLDLSLTSGQIPSKGSTTVTLTVSRAGLLFGLHQGALVLSSNGGSAAANVSVNASPSGSPPPSSSNPGEIQVSPSALNFGSSLSELQLTVFNAGDEPFDWSGDPGASWITMTPASGRVSPHSSSLVTVRAIRSGLTGGTYQTSLRLESNGKSINTPATVVVASGGASPPPPDPEPGPNPKPKPDPEPTPDPTPTPAPEPAPDPTPAPSPSPSPSGQIEVLPSSVVFGETKTTFYLQVGNKGTTDLNYTAKATESWVSLSSTSGTIPKNAPYVHLLTVTASRSSLSAAGLYQATIEFTYGGGKTTIPVSLTVSSGPESPPDGGWNLSNIDATGSRDVTNALNEYFASVPDGAVINLPAGARYKAEGVVRLINKRNIVIEGNGATIFATTDGSDFPAPEDLKHLWPRKRSHLRIDDGSNIHIKNLRIVGANPYAGTSDAAWLSAYEAQHAFEIDGAVGVELEGVYASDIYGDFLYFGGGSKGWADDVYVHDSRFERNGRQGISIGAGQNILIEANVFDAIRRSNIDLEPPTANGGAINVTIRGNTFGTRRLTFLASLGNGPNVRNIVVEDNVTSQPLSIIVGVSDARRGPFIIRNNESTTSYGSDSPLMEFTNVDGVEVVGNYQQLNANRSRMLVGVRNCTKVDVHGNQFPGGLYEVVTSW